MKRWIAILAGVIMLLQVSACVTAPETHMPESTGDLSYDMKQVGHFADIFDEKTPDQWDALGKYTIALEGLHTGVLVGMNGRDVLSVSAYGQTAQLGTDGGLYQDCSPVSISAVEGAVLVNVTWDYAGKTFLLTKDKCYTFQPEDNISTQLFLRADGTLAYGRYWGEYVTSFEQTDTAPLELCAARDQFLYETGRAALVDGQILLTAEETVTVSDLYDLDAMFAQAKALGQYQAFETVDDLFAAAAVG